MGKNNIIQLYPPKCDTLNQNMLVNPENKLVQSDTLNLSELRLFSINKASKILGIRYESVQKLVRTGRIKAIIVNNKYKIPYRSLVEFTNGTGKANNTISHVPIQEAQARIDNLLKECLS